MEKEKKQGNLRRADNKEGKHKQVLQWHPAFYAGIQIGFSEEAEKLIFENEHQLGTKPKEIDVLIIKKNSSDTIHKNIRRIFRKYNIVEYKSPEDITITFVCKSYPRKLIQHLERDRGLSIREQEEGIYYIDGDTFPIQMILTSELSRTSNFWLRNLTNDMEDAEEIEERLRR